MTRKHGRHYFRLLPIWAGVLSLVVGFPLLGLASGYSHGDGSAHHATGKTSPHGSGTMGQGKGHPGGSMGGGSHGPHQSASKFIDHILKFKDGMAITDDQAAKLQAIKTDFEKTKIKMKAEIQLASVDLHDLLRDDKGSLNDVEAKLKDLYDTRAGMYFASVKASRDAKAVLTEEQRARMKTVHDRINAYKGTGMGTKGHPGGYKHHGKEQKS
ncbi:MAG: Spy/CpxP family protein refolding chaperone [Nitrospirota bacterium]